MKTIFLTVALSIGGAALAQTAPQTNASPRGSAQSTTAAPAATQDAEASTMQSDAQPSGQTVNDPAQSTGPQGVTQQGTDPNGQAAAPAGANQGVVVGTSRVSQSAPFTPRPAAGEYPACSRTVTDGCVQTYERGVRASRPRR